MLAIYLQLICLTAKASSVHYAFYADVRWDNVENYTLYPDTIPHNHGLHVLPGIYVALEKIKNLKLWPKSPETNPASASNYLRHFYKHGYNQICGTRTGDTGEECFYPGSYDVGVCAMSPPGNDAVSSWYCKNEPPKDNVFAFKGQVNSTNLPLMAEEDTLTLILPDGTGLSETDRSIFVQEFPNASVLPVGVPDYIKRLSRIYDLCGGKLMGIVGSSDNAYFAALASMKLSIPNFVATVSDKNGMYYRRQH